MKVLAKRILTNKDSDINMDVLEDQRVNCFSVMLQMKSGEYLGLIEDAFKKKGGIDGQRDSLKTTTARRIRDRLIQDLSVGAVLPPIVLGFVVENEGSLSEIIKDEDRFRETILPNPAKIFIIDGMQRTAALKEACEQSLEIQERPIRVEFWLSKSINAITYRMLVLNTGQIPWNLRRQLEVVFKQIIRELENSIPNIDIIPVDEKRQRRGAGQFKGNDIVELYLVFGAKKEKIDLQERLADEFTRQDFIESVAQLEFTERFCKVIDYLVKFDTTISRDDRDLDGQFRSGKDLFRSQPACVGFVTAVALAVMGRPGKNISAEEQQKLWDKFQESIKPFLEKLQNREDDDLYEFLALDLLNELTGKSGTTKGYYERELFKEAFALLIKDEFKVDSMAECWRAYR